MSLKNTESSATLKATISYWTTKNLLVAIVAIYGLRLHVAIAHSVRDWLWKCIWGQLHHPRGLSIQKEEEEKKKKEKKKDEKKLFDVAHVRISRNQWQPEKK